MRITSCERMSAEICARENPKLDFGTFAGGTELIGSGLVTEGVGNIQMGRSGMNLCGKCESFQYSRSTPSIGISVYGSSGPRKNMAHALRFSWMLPILETMWRQRPCMLDQIPGDVPVPRSFALANLGGAGEILGFPFGTCCFCSHLRYSVE